MRCWQRFPCILGRPEPLAPPWNLHLCEPRVAQRLQAAPVERALAPHFWLKWGGLSRASIGLCIFLGLPMVNYLHHIQVGMAHWPIEYSLLDWHIEPVAAHHSISLWGSLGQFSLDGLTAWPLHRGELDSKKIDYISTPTTYWYKAGPMYGGGLVAGYAVCAYVNAKNSYGGYTGGKLSWFLIKNDRVILSFMSTSRTR